VKRVNIILKDDVHTKAKLVAILKGTTLNSYIEQAIITSLTKEKEVLNKLKRQL
jgi:hypothetical protein